MECSEDIVAARECLGRLLEPKSRENCLLILSKSRERFPNLATELWSTPGAVAALLLEIITIYPLLGSNGISSTASTRVCNALTLLQTLCNEASSAKLVLEANLPVYLIPLLGTSHGSRSQEYLRLTTLGVFGALARQSDPEIASYLLNNDMIPICMRIINSGSELCSSVAVFIIQRLITDDQGFAFVCGAYERYFALMNAFQSMLQRSKPSAGPLKHILSCLIRLAQDQRIRENVQSMLQFIAQNDALAVMIATNESLSPLWTDAKELTQF